MRGGDSVQSAAKMKADQTRKRAAAMAALASDNIEEIPRRHVYGYHWGVVTANIKKSLDQHTPLATPIIVQQFAEPLHLWKVVVLSALGCML